MSDSFLGDAESLELLLPLQGKATGLAAAVRARCSAAWTVCSNSPNQAI